MNIVKMKCPNCSADITYHVGAKIAKCEFCDSQIYLDDGSRKLIITDEAEIAKINLVKDVIDFEQARNEKIQKDYDNDKKKSQRWMITTIAFHLIIPIASLIGLFRNENSFAIFLLFFIVLIAPIILGALKPNNASRHGKGFFIILFYFTLIGAIIGFVYLRNFFMSNILG